MAVNTKNMDLEAAKASAREAALARKTCEGCAALQTWPRPQCKGEASPHFRQVRDTYHERCQVYSVRMGQGAPQPVEPAPSAPPSVDAQLRLLKARNRTRRVSP